MLLLPQQEDTATDTTDSSESSSAWAWGLVIVVAAGLLVYGITALVRRRNRRARAEQFWRSGGERILGEATTTAAILAAASVGLSPIDQASEAVKRASADLQRLATDAPDTESAHAATAVIARLRAVLFDAEADALLRAGAPGAAPATTRPPADTDLIATLDRLRACMPHSPGPQT